jgi:hypothetical protein
MQIAQSDSRPTRCAFARAVIGTSPRLGLFALTLAK